MDVNYTRADGSGNVKMDARVVAYEEVVVPAGKFMAFKIEHDGFVRTGNFNGRMVETYWYAPEARADVKHVRQVARTDFTRELVKFPPSAGEKPSVGVTKSMAAPASPNAASSLSGSPAATQLRELEQLRKDGLITEQEYEEKRKAVLSKL